ncbi:hypothetical protein ACHMZP_32120 [Rhodococcus baikonurensis]|uniref:ISAzo13-like element transposase-related protein n=1 Tax=Rhodococcus baikonurensis TaxID=172041 RepID=UPI0037BD8CB9
MAELPGEYRVSPVTLMRILRSLGFTVDSSPGPSRIERHTRVEARMGELVEALEPAGRRGVVLSVRTERRLRLADDDRLRQGSTEPFAERAALRDFADVGSESPIPYGVFDIGVNENWERVDDDMSMIACGVRTWWEQNSDRQSGCDRITVVAPGRDSRSSDPCDDESAALLSNQLGVAIEVVRVPRCIWRWSNVESRVFAITATNVRGRPLAVTRVVVEVPTISTI